MIFKQLPTFAKKMLASNPSPDTAIEAYFQLGEIFLYQFNDKNSAKNFVDKGIEICKKKYSAVQIEKFVNGIDWRVNMTEPIGKTNTIRELYILKSDIENLSPKFDEKTVVKNNNLLEDMIYDLKYRTDW